MFKKLFTALLCIANFKITLSVINKAKKPNEITRIKTPARITVHAHSLTKNNFQYLFKWEYREGFIQAFKPLCPVCNGGGVYSFKSAVIPCESHFVDLSFFDDCLMCGGSGILEGARFSEWFLSTVSQREFAVTLLCYQEAFKTPADDLKFLPMVVSK